ncbi:MAG: carboxypeptidase regulatory-like domain-containing protein, partial [Acidobacteriaceae bacterium]|nr:carboxypeptidase regulatory-like domain-containing protein [Acidobacteriaceae bacterium]
MSRPALALSALLLCMISATYAQDTATIAGTVTDQSGASVGSAQVTLVNSGTHFTRVVETNDSGHYVASSIPTGEYVISVMKTGFEKLERSGVQLTAATTLSVDLQLVVGSQTQTISVVASTPLLQSESADVSSLVDTKQILTMPMVSRDFTDLVLLTPGAHAGSAANLAENGSPYTIRGGANYSVNGAAAAGNSYLIDGMYNRNLWLNTLVIVPVVDAIQEYRVMTSNYSAQYGEAAGAVTEVETKSGSNQFHGSAWEFLRNDKLNANPFFNNFNGVPRPGFRRNEFGGTIGGPIIRNRTFIFGDYQGIRLSQPQTYTSTIPTLAQQQMVETGNFAGLGTTIYNPYQTQTVSGVTTRIAFPSNQIPANLLDAAAMRFFKLLPAPTSSGATNNFTFNPALTQTTDQFDVRIDQNLAASDHLFFRYSYDNSNQVVPGTLPAVNTSGIPVGTYLATTGAGQTSTATGTTTPLLNQSAVLGYSKTFNPNTVLDSHFGVVRWNANITPLAAGFNTASAIGIPGININDKSGGLPAFTISGFQTLGDNSTFPEDSQITSFQADTALTKIRGSHTFKAGFLFLRHRFNGFSAFPTRGTFDFNGQFTRQLGSSTSQTALADFALGAMDSASRNILTGTFGMRIFQLAPFVQDTWRITDRLTLDLGFRWEVDAPPYEVHNRWANLNVATGQLVVAGVNGNGRRLREFDLNTPAPRVGIAYALGSDRKTVIRSGFGISYVDMDAGGAQLYKNLPFYFAQNITTDINGTPVSTLSRGLPIPIQPSITDETALSSGSPNVWNMSLRETEILQWSFGIQRQLFSDMMLSATYVGTRGERILVNNQNLNQSIPGPGAQGPRRPYFRINPNLVNVAYRTNAGDSKYESLQLHAEKRFSRGLTFGASYTYASYLADTGNPNGGGNGDIQNHFCIACNWGPTPDDYTHVLSINHVYELPFGHDRKYFTHGPLGYILGDWNINGIWTAQSGGRFTAVLGTNVSNSAGGGAQRPNRLRNGNLPSGQRTIAHWFDTSAFTAPTAFTFGNSGTGILRG